MKQPDGGQPGAEIAGQRILIVDDDKAMHRVVEISLAGRERTFVHGATGKEGIELAVRHKPDVIITDYRMPQMTGIELVKNLRQNPFTAHIPILMMSAVSDPDERVNMIRAGVDDFLLKPFHPEELAARVDMVVARCVRELATDHLTRLPGNVLTRQQIRRRLDGAQPFSLCYVDIDRFKSYVDHYGFERASHVVAHVARVIERAVREDGTPGDFVGHIGGDDFLALTTPEVAPAVCDTIITLFAERVPEWYDEEDVARGYIVTPDRDGRERRFTPITISAVIIDSRRTEVTTLEQLADLVVRLKSEAKAREGNTCLVYEGESNG